MIRLFGAMHGGYTTDILLQRREIELEPTLDLERRLKELPPNSRVGIENLSPENWQEVKEHLRELCLTNGLGGGYQSLNRYWEKVAQICNLSDHEVVWLEDKDNWIRYNHALVEAGKVRRKYDELFHEKGESDRDYFRKLLSLNEELHRAQIQSDRIHLLDRDETILRNIASMGCDAVVAGIGHTDAWVLNQEEIRSKYGIKFGAYSTDAIADPQRFILRFIEDAIPDPNLAYDFTSIRRAVNLLENGRLTGENPDWVGVWDVHEPSRGYFELFVEQQNDEVMIGRIEDCLGTAKFEGVFSPRFVRFVKTYGNSTRDAIKSDITYQTEDAGYDREMHQGIFRTDSGGSVFYIEKSNENSPLQMAFSWYDLNQDDESGQRRLF
jgi:hypothetical protein